MSVRRVLLYSLVGCYYGGVLVNGVGAIASAVGSAIGDAADSVKTKVTRNKPMYESDKMGKNIINADWEITDIS